MLKVWPVQSANIKGLLKVYFTLGLRFGLDNYEVE